MELLDAILEQVLQLHCMYCIIYTYYNYNFNAEQINGLILM